MKRASILSVFALSAALAGAASAQTVVSWNFDYFGTVPATTGVAGVVSVDHWNNSTTTTNNNNTRTLLNLIDNTGVATTLDLSYKSYNVYRVTGSHPGVDGDGTYNRELLNGYLNAGSTQTTKSSSVTLSQIPFEHYSLYVYFSSDTAGRTGSVTDGMTTYLFNTIGLTSVSGTSAVLTQTMNTADTTTAANYAVFSGLTSASATITVDIPNFGGIAGFQVVEASAIPEPSTYAAIAGALTLAGVVVIRRRRRA